jgi:hypothetical protein
MLLSACDSNAWQDATSDWVADTLGGAVELIATRSDGMRLAIEHTLIQPFVGEKLDSHAFLKAFAPIENHPALVLAVRQLVAEIPVNAIPKGDPWDRIGEDLLESLVANHASAFLAAQCLEIFGLLSRRPS